MGAHSHRGTATRAAIGLVLAFATSGIAPAAVAASSGQLDPTFAAATARVDIQGTDDEPAVVLARPDGRLVVGMTSARPGNPAPGSDAAFAQSTVTGAQDATFGDAHGHRIVDVGVSQTLLDAALTSDGKIVGITSGHAQAFLFRLNANGTLDTASDGDPASHFGTTGIVPLAFGLSPEDWRHLAIQANGSIVVAGSLSNAPIRPAIVRFTSAGDVDPTFNGGVPVFAQLGDGDATVAGVAISPDGDSIAAAVTALAPGGHRVLGVEKLRTFDGMLDPTFNGSGQVTTAVGTDANATAVVVRADGRITVGGTARRPAQQSHPAIVRYTNAGGLDPTFGTGGVFERAFSNDAHVNALRLTAAGNVVGLTGGIIQAMRLNAAGQADPLFDHDGFMSIRVPGNRSSIIGGTLAPGDRPVLLSSIDVQLANQDVGVTRLVSNGKPDTSFAPAGTGLFDAGPEVSGFGNGVAVMPNHKILVAAEVDPSAGISDFVVRRLTRQGYPDQAFAGGSATVDFGSDIEEAHDVVVSGSTVVAAGCTACEDDSRFAVTRLDRHGVPDPTFSGDGKVTTGFGPGKAARPEAMVIDHKGRIVVAGTVDESDFAVARYLPNGALDQAFSGDGKVLTDIDHGSEDRAFGVAVQDDGKVVVVGEHFTGPSARFAIVRYTAHGVLDPTFGAGGIVTTQVGPGFSAANAVAIRPDGRIIVAGFAADGANGETTAIARYRTNGTLDPAFGHQGLVTDALGFGDDRAAAVSLDVSGRIVFAGFGNTAFLVGRYLANGTLDPTFNGGTGFTYTDIGASEFVGDMAVDPTDGRIVLAGFAQGPGGKQDIAVARYEP